MSISLCTKLRLRVSLNDNTLVEFGWKLSDSVKKSQTSGSLIVPNINVIYKYEYAFNPFSTREVTLPPFYPSSRQNLLSRHFLSRFAVSTLISCFQLCVMIWRFLRYKTTNDFSSVDCF